MLFYKQIDRMKNFTMPVKNIQPGEFKFSRVNINWEVYTFDYGHGAFKIN
jgi:diphthamide synthase subunit DPH2